MLTGTTRIEALTMPTGSGKSICAIAWALLSKKPTCYVTDSKGLQDQLTRDFGSIGLVDLRGRSNYPCDLRPGISCQEGYAANCPYKGTPRCPSSSAEMKAATSLLVTTNYAKWTASKKFGQGMEHFQQVVFDEGHQSYHALAETMQVVLHHKEIEQTLKLNFPPAYECGTLHAWKPWAAEAKGIAMLEMQRAQHKMQTGSDHQSVHVKHYTHMRNLVKRLATISTARATNWVVDETDQGYQFDPIRPGRYAEAALLLRVPRIVVMSATLRPKTLYMIGIPKTRFRFTEFDSDFDPARCPVYYVPTMRVDKNAKDLSPLWNRIDQVASRRRDRKGMIHTVSFYRQSEVLGSSRFAGSMILNPRGEATSTTIAEYAEAPDGSILVSPSVGAGYDFAGSLCEWQVLCKIPFPDGRSKVMKARQEDDKEYGPYQAMQKLVQTCGRPMRSKTDQAESFLFDDHAEWFVPRWGHLAPRSFHARYKRVDVLPQPPPRLEPR